MFLNTILSILFQRRKVTIVRRWLLVTYKINARKRISACFFCLVRDAQYKNRRIVARSSVMHDTCVSLSRCCTWYTFMYAIIASLRWGFSSSRNIFMTTLFADPMIDPRHRIKFLNYILAKISPTAILWHGKLKKKRKK